jgi:hypothetical protein
MADVQEDVHSKESVGRHEGAAELLGEQVGCKTHFFNSLCTLCSLVRYPLCAAACQ